MLRGWGWCFPQSRASKLPHPSSRWNAAEWWRWLFGPHVNRADRPDCLTTLPSSLVCYHNCGKKRKTDWFCFFWGQIAVLLMHCGAHDGARVTETACLGTRSKIRNVRTVTLAWVESLFVAATVSCTPYFLLSNLYMQSPHMTRWNCCLWFHARLLIYSTRYWFTLLQFWLCYRLPQAVCKLTQDLKKAARTLLSSYQNSNSSREEKTVEINRLINSMCVFDWLTHTSEGTVKA